MHVHFCSIISTRTVSCNTENFMQLRKSTVTSCTDAIICIQSYYYEANK